MNQSKTYLFTLFQFIAALSFAQQESQECAIDIGLIRNTNNGIELTIHVDRRVKNHSITILNCQNGKSNLELPNHLKQGAFTYFISGEFCECDGDIEYVIYTESPKCNEIRSLAKALCIAHTKPDTAYIVKIDTQYITRTFIDTVYIQKVDPCDVCSVPWNCFEECFLCWLFGFFVGIYFLIRILLIAADSRLEIPIVGTIIWSNFWEFLCGSFAIAFIASCPCQSAFFGIMGLGTGILFVLIDRIQKGDRYPEWRSSILVALGIAVALLSVINLNCA